MFPDFPVIPGTTGWREPNPLEKCGGQVNARIGELWGPHGDVGQERLSIRRRDRDLLAGAITDQHSIHRQSEAAAPVGAGPNARDCGVGNPLPDQSGADQQALRRGLVGLRVQASQHREQDQPGNPVIPSQHWRRDSAKYDRSGPPVDLGFVPQLESSVRMLPLKLCERKLPDYGLGDLLRCILRLGANPE